MVTETMLFLSIRQNNWDAATEIAAKLRSQDLSKQQQALYIAVSHAAKGDTIAQFLLTIMVEAQWNN